MGSVLATLATIIVAALAALFALPLFVDWNEYKTQFEVQAAKLVGRPVLIQGDVDLTILPVPRLSLRGLRIADEFGKFERPFAEVEEFNAILSIPPLLSGTMEAKSVELDQPILRLKIDEFGEGTWQSIGPYGFNIPVPVREVVLNKVSIKDGAIELRHARQRPAARFDRISGIFAADSLRGPYRFTGVGAIGGGDKEIQLSAARPKGSENLRLKASLRSIDGVSLYQLDGEIKGLEGPVHYEGPVAARLALDTKAKQAETDQIAEPLPGKAIELRAAAKITLDDANLDNITLTVTQNDRPQSVTGTAYASWKLTPRLDLSINASWLDFDQMLGPHAQGERPVPTTAIAALPRVFEGWSFKPRQGNIKAKIQQAGLGGDVIEGLDFVASHNADGWQIETLTAHLPGDTDIDVHGTLPAGDKLAFSGNFTLDGRNLSRLLRWSAPSIGIVDTGNAEHFSLASDFTLSPEQLSFAKAKGALGDSSFQGDLVHEYGAKSKLLLALESERLDLRSLYAGRNGATEADTPEENLATIEPYKATNDWTAQTVPAQKTNLADLLRTVFKAEESSVRLIIAQLQLPDFEARDIHSAFRYENGTFDISALNVSTLDGLKVKANGRITGFESTPDGALNLSIDAPSAQSVTNLTRLIGLDSVSSGARRRIEALSPFHLSGSLKADAGKTLMKLSFAGNAGGSELSLNGTVNGDIKRLGDANVDVNGVIGNSDGRRLIAQLAPEVPLDKTGTQTGAGYLKVSALGAISSGLDSRIDLRTPQARGQFEGRISGLDQPAWGFKGKLDMRAAQAATALSMLRLSPGGTPVTGAIDLRASLSKEASKFQVADLTLKIGGETVRGTADIDVAGEKPFAKIDINAASIALPKIAAYLVDWDRQDATSQIADVTGGGPALWPSHAFSLSSLHAVDASLTLKAPSILITDKISLSDGELNASLRSGALKVTKLEGALYGGRFTGSGSLTALKGRAAFEGTLKLENADLAKLSRTHGGTELASGTADLDLSLESQGLSPRGLISVISGKGELSLSKGAIYGLSPSELEKAASTYLKQEIPDKEQLVAKLEGDFRKGRLQYKAMSMPLNVKDGVLRIAQIELKSPEYQLEAEAVADLASFRFDSEWRIAYPKAVENGQRLPPVRLVFAGPLSSFSAVKPQLYADQFERFLTIRRMDQDMERLEKLNEQRGVPRGSSEPRSGSPDANAAVAPNTEDSPGTAIPAHSLLRAPPGALDEPDANPSAPNSGAGQTGTQPAPSAAAGSWTTGMETTAEQPPQSPQATPKAAPPPVKDFEAQIKEVLRSQREEGQPRYPQQ